MRENAHSRTFLFISLLNPNVPKSCCKFHENKFIKSVISTFECLSTIIVNLQLDCQFHFRGEGPKKRSNFEGSPCTHIAADLDEI